MFGPDRRKTSMRFALPIAFFCLALLPGMAAAGSAPPPFPQTEEERKTFAETVCGEIAARKIRQIHIAEIGDR